MTDEAGSSRPSPWPRRAGSAAVAAALGAVVVLVVSGGTTGAPAALAATVGACRAGAPTLTVAGVGRATTTSDLLTLTLGVSVTTPHAAEALAADDAATAAVVGALTAGGVRQADIQTANLSIQPQYGATGQGVTGYTAQDTVVAKVRKVSSAGSVIDAAVTAGGDAVRIDSVTFSTADPTSVQDRARATAVRQAVRHAASMARAAGEHLGPICRLEDDTTTTPPVWPWARFGAAASAATPGAVPVQPGTQEVTDRVTVVYALATGRTAP